MTLSEMMRAIAISEPGGPEVLEPITRPLPRPGPSQILIHLQAAGVNRPDALQRAGSYAPPPTASDLPGLEGAGTVAAIGGLVTRWSVGEAVCALLPGGGYAEYAVCDQDHALRLPRGMGMTRAAALCETFFTVWSNVFMRAGLTGGETFLVHGGTSGIGTTAIQLGRAFGARVFASAGTEEKCARCRELGAEVAINYRSQDFVKEVREATDGRGVDLILDMVGGDYIGRNIRALADDGRLVMIAFLGGAKAELNFAQIMARRLTVTGSTLRPQSDSVKARIAEQLRTRVWPLLDCGVVGPVIDSTFALDAAPDAHRRLEDPDHVGKIVLEIG
ncbi:MAG: NAD(P)H-quinone oxidoreductase [Paracoccaceae bacterium]